jgi:hypothetical protein
MTDFKAHRVRKTEFDRNMAVGVLNVQSLTNKSDAVLELIRQRALDALLHVASDDSCLRHAVPGGYCARLVVVEV